MTNYRSQTVYLHLRPGYLPNELVVAKLAKSLDAQVEPGDIIVKAKVSVPSDFFKTARPYAEVTFTPDNAVQPTVSIIPEGEEQS